MPSSFTLNKSIEQPASGSYNNAWAAPVNADWEDIDNAFGGHALINVTGASGTVALTLPQYQPPNLEFIGTISANVTYVLPTGVGGIWSVLNNTTGAFTLSFAVAGGGGSGVQQGQRTLFVCDGNTMSLADTAAAAQAQANAEAFATAADVVVTNNTEAFATAADTAVLANAEAFSANASNLSSGTVANARLNNVGLGPGVTIAADPGTTPSGSPGQMFLYY